MINRKLQTRRKIMSTKFENGVKCIKYIYEIPFVERKEIGRIFDDQQLWQILGGTHMGYSPEELSGFNRALYIGGSPTEALLTSWGNQNHTILELFIIFAKLQQYRAMRILSKFVDVKYHEYIKDSVDCNATAELKLLDNQIKPEDPNKNVEGTVNKAQTQEVFKGVDVDLGGNLPKIRYDELLLATDNWNRRNILGKGGFGTVFKGQWKHTHVAIKRMELRGKDAYVQSNLKQSLGELRFLNNYRHDNILPLYGYCLEGEHPCLIYQYMQNGSLEDRLLCKQNFPPLPWQLRYQIVRNVACGLQFLHSIGPQPLIHGDIKSANILLDKNFEAKIGDFGLAREMHSNSSYVKVSRVHGTRPYLPDEYLRSKKLSTKVDSFSFGIMIFEVATGFRAYEEHRSVKFLRDMLDECERTGESLRDIKGGYENQEIYEILIKLGKMCTRKIAKERPDMVSVLKSLEEQFSNGSIRTVSSQVTGLPFLFETPHQSRPGSLLIPSSTTHRLSPEMRNFHIGTMGSNPMRRSPLPSPVIPLLPAVVSVQQNNLQINRNSNSDNVKVSDDIPQVVEDMSTNHNIPVETVIPLITELGL